MILVQIKNPKPLKNGPTRLLAREELAQFLKNKKVKNYPLVSIVIPTYNEEGNIGLCLQSIKEQIYFQNRIETIVVDNNSIDRTVEIAKKFTEKVYNKGPERSAQRNFGVQEAKGKYILYLDADMILSESVIQEGVNKFESEDCIALYIPERIIGESFWIRVRDFERSFYNATCIDAIRLIRKDKFLQVGGFDENFFVAEDWDFNRRIRETGKLGIIKSPLYHNEGNFHLKKYLWKKTYYLKKIDNYIKKWGKDDPIIKKQLGFRYRLFVVFLENGKWKKLLRHPSLTLGMYFLRFLVGIRYQIMK